MSKTRITIRKLRGDGKHVYHGVGSLSGSKWNLLWMNPEGMVDVGPRACIPLLYATRAKAEKIATFIRLKLA